MQYLKDKQDYIDRYDLLTIKECLDNIQMLQRVGKKMEADFKMKKMPKQELDRNLNLMMGRFLFFIKAHRYKNRATTIDQWIEQDQANV